MRPRSVPVAIAATLAAALVARLAVRTARELRDFRKARNQLASRWVTIAGVVGRSPLRIHTRIAAGGRGSAAPIVLVHGFGVGSAYHVPVMPRLARSAPVYAPDLPGHGRSDHDARPLNARELARALAAWMDAAGVRSALLVGHSYGCQIAAELSVTRPELISRLVLIGPMSDPSARTAPRLLARAVVTIPFEPPSFLLLGLTEFGRAGLAVLAADLREMLAYRIEAVLPRSSHPALIIRGARDFLAPQAWTAALAKRAGAPRPHVVPRRAHAVNYAAPAPIAEAIMPVR